MTEATQMPVRTFCSLALSTLVLSMCKVHRRGGRMIFSEYFTVLTVCRRYFSKNRLAELALKINNKGVNVPNAITLARIPLIFAIGFFFYASFAGSKTLAFILYVLTGITDWLDGWAARKYHQISDFGKLADALIDKIFIIGMFLLLAGKGLVPTWGIFCMLLIVCREFFITGLRVMVAKSGTVLAAEKSGKLKTILQIVFTGAFFLIEMLRIDASAWFPKEGIHLLTVINNVLFVTATFLTVHSGCHYWQRYHRSLS